MIERATGYMEKLLKKATYAINNKSRNLVYQAYGSACAAYELGAITKNEFFELNTMLVRNTINNKIWRLFK